jgi:hypothetical protein
MSKLSNLQKQNLFYSFRRFVVIPVVALILASCGGGDGSSSAIVSEPSSSLSVSGKVVDGYIRGAIVFWDCNDNWNADADEVQTNSLAGGTYSIALAPQPACVLRAAVGVGAIDEDGNFPILRPFVMSALPGKPILITPLTTLVAMGVGTEESVATSLGIPSDFSKDFLASATADQRSHNAARTIAVQLQNLSAGTVVTSDTAINQGKAIVSNTQYVLANANSLAPISFSDILNWLNTSPSQYFFSPFPSIPLPAATAVSGKAGLSGAQTALLQEILAKAISKNAVHGNQIVFSLLSEEDLVGLNPRLETAFGNNQAVVALLAARQSEIEILNVEFDKALKGQNKALDAQTSVALLTNAARSIYGISEVVTAITPVSYPLGIAKQFSYGVTVTGKLQKYKGNVNRLLRIASRIPTCAAAVSAVVDVVVQADPLAPYTDEDTVRLADVGLNLGACLATFFKSNPKVESFFAGSSVGRAATLKEQIDIVEAAKSVIDVLAGTQPTAAPFMMFVDGILDYFLGLWATHKAIEDLNDAISQNILATAEQLAASQKPLIDNILRSFKRRILAERVNLYLASNDTACPTRAVVINLVCVDQSVATLDSITPLAATINQPTLITVTGTNLPATAELSISGGATCASPIRSSDLSSGFKQTCTFSGSEGTRSVSVLTQAGGPIIGAAQTILVTAAPAVTPPTSGNVFFEDFNTVNADGTIGGANNGVWQRFASTGGVCNSPPSSISNIVTTGGQTTFGNCNYIQTNATKTFSGDRYVIEARFAGTGGGRNTYIGLIENDSTVNETSPAHQIFIGDTNYSATALPGVYVYQFKNGTYLPDSRGLMPSTAAFKEYRITIEGTSVIIERGDSLSNLTERATTTLSSSVSGKTFALRVGTAGAPYYPGVFDWVRVSTTQTPSTAGVLNPANGHRYEVITCGTFAQCQTAARVKGGNLVTIRNAAENSWLLANILNTSSNAMFIGLYKTGATWSWSSGESTGFTAWLPGRPDNFGGNQNYVHISSGNQAWDDVADAFYGAATQAVVEYSLSGTFAVAANNPSGTLFTVPAGSSSCAFSATGTWNLASGSAYAVDSNGRGSSLSGPTFPPFNWIMANAPAYALVGKKANSTFLIGSNVQIAVNAGEQLYLLMNDDINSFGDNSGSLLVQYLCQ